MRDNATISEHGDPTSAPAAARDAERARDAAWVRAAQRGDPGAFSRLYDAWFDRVFHLAARILRDSDSAGDVCQDAFLSAWRNLGSLQDPEAFGGWLLRIARNAAYDRSAREARTRPVDDEGLAVIEAQGASPAGAPAGFDVVDRLGRAADPAAAVADGEVAALVWDTVDSLGERDAQVLELQLRLGMSPAEVGEVMGLNRNAANQLCHRVRQRFAAAFRARTLWRGAEPACAELSAALRTAGVVGWGPDAAAIADRHLGSCAACQERSELRVQPAALFAAVPLLAAPVSLKRLVAERLAAEGVPLDPSALGAPDGSAAGGPHEGADAGPEGGGASPDVTDPGTAGRASGEPAPAAPAPDATVVLPAPPPAPPAAARLAPPPPPPPPVPAAHAARRWGAAAVVLLVVAAAVALLARGDDGDEVAARTGGGSTTSELVLDDGAEAPPSTDDQPEVTDPTSGPTVTDPAPSSTAPPEPTTTTPTTAPTTTAAPPRIVRFELWNTGDQHSPYPYGPGSPTVRWEVEGADSVTVRLWTDPDHDGPVGPIPGPVLSTAPTGELVLCPGTVDAGQCHAPPGRYTVTLEASGPGGAVTSDQANPPGFDVYPLIIP